jgi:16S rRNA (guanine966-N2)-methyltransferase
VRVALFARLGELDGARVLDLYAGTGTLGIEAISRGAREVVFIDHAPRSLAVLRANLSALGVTPNARIVPGDAVRAVQRLGREGVPFDLVLLDPPYAAGEVGRALAAVVAARVLAPTALVVVESGRRHPVPDVTGLARLDERRYGDTVITQLVAAPPDESAGPATTAGGASDTAARGGRRSG